MGTPREEAALTVDFPRNGTTADATNETGIVRVAGSASSVPVAVPSGMKGRWVRVRSVGVNTNICVTLYGAGGVSAPTAPTLVYGQLSAFGTGHLAAAASVLSGEYQDLYVPLNAYQFVYIQETATGTLEVYVNSRKVEARA